MKRETCKKCCWHMEWLLGEAWCMKRRKTTSMNDTCPDHAEDRAPVTPPCYPSGVQTVTDTPPYDD